MTAAEEGAGAPCIYGCADAARAWLVDEAEKIATARPGGGQEDDGEPGSAQAMAAAARTKEEAQMASQEALRLDSTPCTPETFAAWKDGYMAEIALAAARAREAEARTAGGGGGGKKAGKGGAAEERLTGRAWFERGAGKQQQEEEDVLGEDGEDVDFSDLSSRADTLASDDVSDGDDSDDDDALLDSLAEAVAEKQGLESET